MLTQRVTALTMDATQLIALQAASNRITTAQAAAQQAVTAATAAETAAATAATADPVILADVTAANATVTQARAAVLIANNEVEAATAAVNALMVKPAKAFKPHGQAPPFDMEERKDSFDVWETQWNVGALVLSTDETNVFTSLSVRPD